MILLSHQPPNQNANMPSGMMNEGSTERAAQPVTTTGEMPPGHMTDSPVLTNGHLASAGSEMPTGSMTEAATATQGDGQMPSTNAMPTAGPPPTGGEMPPMTTNQAGAKSEAETAGLNTFELAGSWVLQLQIKQATTR